MNNQDGLWENLLKRLRGVVRDHRGYGAAVVTVSLVVVGDELKGWYNPEVQKFEPFSARGDLADLILKNGNGEPRGTRD